MYVIAIAMRPKEIIGSSKGKPIGTCPTLFGDSLGPPLSQLRPETSIENTYYMEELGKTERLRWKIGGHLARA